MNSCFVCPPVIYLSPQKAAYSRIVQNLDKSQALNVLGDLGVVLPDAETRSAFYVISILNEKLRQLTFPSPDHKIALPFSNRVIADLCTICQRYVCCVHTRTCSKCEKKNCIGCTIIFPGGSLRSDTVLCILCSWTNKKRWWFKLYGFSSRILTYQIVLIS